MSPDIKTSIAVATDNHDAQINFRFWPGPNSNEFRSGRFPFEVFSEPLHKALAEISIPNRSVERCRVDVTSFSMTVTGRTRNNDFRISASVQLANDSGIGDIPISFEISRTALSDISYYDNNCAIRFVFERTRRKLVAIHKNAVIWMRADPALREPENALVERFPLTCDSLADGLRVARVFGRKNNDRFCDGFWFKVGSLFAINETGVSHVKIDGLPETMNVGVSAPQVDNFVSAFRRLRGQIIFGRSMKDAGFFSNNLSIVWTVPLLAPELPLHALSLEPEHWLDLDRNDLLRKITCALNWFEDAQLMIERRNSVRRLVVFRAGGSCLMTYWAVAQTLAFEDDAIEFDDPAAHFTLRDLYALIDTSSGTLKLGLDGKFLVIEHSSDGISGRSVLCSHPPMQGRTKKTRRLLAKSDAKDRQRK